MKQHYKKALDVMVALAGAESSEDVTVKRDFNEIKESITLEQSPHTKRNTRPLFRLILGVGAQAMQQLTGINVICYYLPYVLTESVGLEGSTARLLAAVNAMTYLGSTFIGLFFIERWGRRPLMILGVFGQCCCWLAITVLLSRSEHTAPPFTQQRQLAAAAVLFFFLFNCFFGAGWQGVSWLYPTEINSTRHRISGMSYGVATNWLINFSVVFITPLGIARLGPYFYIIWTVLNGLIIPTIWMFYPETAGRSLEDIDGMFEAHPTVWVFRHPSMVSRKPILDLTDEAVIRDVVELSEFPATFVVETATLAERPSSTPFQIEIANRSTTRLRQPSGDHPGTLVSGSLSSESNREDGVDLMHTDTAVTTQSGPSLGPQVSTTPLL